MHISRIADHKSAHSTEHDINITHDETPLMHDAFFNVVKQNSDGQMQ